MAKQDRAIPLAAPPDATRQMWARRIKPKVPAANRGFILLVVLTIVAILGASVGLLAWRAATRSVCANAEVAYQRNVMAAVAALGILRHSLTHGELLSKIEETGRLHGKLSLGGIPVYYSAWDEASKTRFDPKNRGSVLPGKLAATGVRLRERKEGDDSANAVFTFEDVFEIGVEELDKFYGPSTRQEPAIHFVTLWGDGRLNLNTASEDSIREILADLPSQTIETILTLRRYGAIDDLSRLADSLGLQGRDRQTVLSRFTVGTSCVSVRLMVAGPVIRSDVFAVLRIEQGSAQVLLWKELPPTGELPGEDETELADSPPDIVCRRAVYANATSKRRAVA